MKNLIILVCIALGATISIYSNADMSYQTNQEIINLNETALPPEYLSVPNFKQCLGTKNMGTWQSVCKPLENPDACDLGSWLELKKMDIPNC